MGSNADDAIIDKYAAQHFGSFTRAMERQTQQAAGNAARSTGQQLQQTPQQQPQQDTDMTATTTTANAFKSPPPMSSPSSAPYFLQASPAVATSALDDFSGGSINPSAVALSSAPSAFDASAVLPTPSIAATATKVQQAQMHVPAPASTSPAHRSEDAMSEDDNEDEEESKDGLNELPSAQRTSPAGLEEAPIAGSIMGPANELRPDPETYRNLTSKEKRQLRNKISARNFRTRRKEHISTLEQQVDERDTMIEGLRNQLAQVTLQNKELQDEVRQLKSKVISPVDMQRLIEALQKTGVVGQGQQQSDSTASSTSHLARPGSSSSLNSNENGTTSRPMSPRPPGGPSSVTASPSLTRPNTRKDVPATQGGASGVHSFWGGAVGGSGWPVSSSPAVA